MEAFKYVRDLGKCMMRAAVTIFNSRPSLSVQITLWGRRGNHLVGYYQSSRSD